MRRPKPRPVPTLDEAHERVARGAIKLDEHRPGWWGTIDLQRLRISGANDCMLAQLDAYSLYRGENSVVDAEYDGFIIEQIPYHKEDGGDLEIDEAYATLQQAWTELIQSRRS